MERLTEAQSHLAGRYYPMARALARPFVDTYPWLRDDFVSESTYALMEAARSFDPSYGVKFSTYARTKIQWALKDALRSSIRRATPYSFEGTEPDASGQVVGRDEIIPADQEVAQDEYFEHLVGLFPEHVRELLRLKYRDGISLSRAYRMAGVTRYQFCQGLKEARIKGSHLCEAACHSH